MEIVTVTMPTWLKNAWAVFGAIGSLAFGVAVVRAAIRRDSPLLKIPWWWWVGNGGSLLLVSAGNSGLVQAATIVGGWLSVGIGLSELAIAYREGRLHIRKKRRPSPYDVIAAIDWEGGAHFVHVLEVVPSISNLRANDPYIEFSVRVLNANVHTAILLPEVRGRIEVPDERDTFSPLTHEPELIQIAVLETSIYSTSRLINGQEQNLERNKLYVILLRQHLVPAVRDSLMTHKAGKDVPFNLTRVDVGLCFERWDPENGSERSTRQRLGLDTCKVHIS